MSDSLWPHGWQHVRFSCSSSSSGVCPSSCLLCQLCHPTISSYIVPFSSCFAVFPSNRVFSNELALHTRWVKYWTSASVRPVNSQGWFPLGLTDWFDLLAVQGTLQESSPTPLFEGINSSTPNLLYGSTLISVHDYWKNHSFDCIDLCWQINVCFLICCLGLWQLFLEGTSVF